MAANGSGDADIKQKLERIESKLGQLDAAAGKLKIVGRVMTVLVVIVAITMVINMLSPAIALYKNPAPLTTKVKEGLESRVVPTAKTELLKAKDTLVPVYSKAAEKVFKDREVEIYQKVRSEADGLYADLEKSLGVKLEDFGKALAEKQYARLVKEYPQIENLDKKTDPANPGMRKMDLIHGSVIHASQKLTDEYFRTHFDALAKLEAEFNAIEVPANVKVMDTKELEAHVSDLAMQFVSKKFEAATPKK